MKAKHAEKIAFGALTLCGVVVVAPIAGILALLVIKGAPAINIGFLTRMPHSDLKEGGLFPAIVGTICLVSLAIAIALPLGVACAVYLNELAADNAFTDQFMAALFLPHTDETQFPSVIKVMTIMVTSKYTLNVLTVSSLSSVQSRFGSFHEL